MMKRKAAVAELTRSSQRQWGPGLAAQATVVVLGSAMMLGAWGTLTAVFSVLRVAMVLRRRLPTLLQSQPRATPTTGDASWRKTAN